MEMEESNDGITKKRRSIYMNDTLPIIPETSSKESTMIGTFHPDKTVSWEMSIPTLEPYELALYDLFGEDAANDILHPKMGFPLKTKVNRRLNEKRERAQAVIANSKLVNAETLWSTIRCDSTLRLISMDDKIPQHLKETYSAFARERFQKNINPPKRNFCNENELEELAQLKATSKVDQIHRHRRIKELMFRQAHSHEDQYRNIMENRPFPAVSDLQGGISQYLLDGQLSSLSNNDNLLRNSGIVPENSFIIEPDGQDFVYNNKKYRIYKEKHLIQSTRKQILPAIQDNASGAKLVGSKKTSVIDIVKKNSENNLCDVGMLRAGQQQVPPPLDWDALVEYKPTKAPLFESKQVDYRSGRAPVWCKQEATAQ